MASDVNAAFAASMKRLRAERAWSQAELAAAAGVSVCTVSNAEARRNGVSLRVADALAAALGTTVDGMTGRTNPEASRG